MLPEEKPTNRWLVRGLVVGSRFLQRAAQLRVDPLEMLRKQFGPVGVFSLTLPITHYTESKYELSITVTATNPPLAVSNAVEEADEYLGALTLAVGEQKYLFGPTVVEKLPDARGIYTHQHLASGFGVAGVFYPKALERDFQDLTLRTAGETLGVEERFVEFALELSELHNKKLNQPGSMGTEDLNEWIYKSEDPRLSGDPGHFGKGELTAMAYLEAYATCYRNGEKR